MKLRIALLQLNPRIGEVEANIAKVWRLLRNVPPCDMVVLPELAITGYNFPSRSAISPYLEGETRFTSTTLAQEISKKLSCFTVIGYPEISRNTVYNSCKLVDPKGNEVYNYRKTHLYETDEVWGCSENPDKSFKSVEIEVGGKRVVVNFGICMDLNPYQFKAPFNEFEFSMACYQNRANLIICPMAWLSPYSPSLIEGSPDEKRHRSLELQKIKPNGPVENLTECGLNFSDKTFNASSPDLSTVNYWILRFFPFLSHPHSAIPKYGKVSILACNRTGIEDDVLYGGSSSIFQFTGETGNDDLTMNNPSVVVSGALPSAFEGVLFREIDA